MSLWSPSLSCPYRDQLIRVLAYLGLSHKTHSYLSGFSGSMNTSWGYFLVLKYVTGIDTLSSWQDSHIMLLLNILWLTHVKLKMHSFSQNWNVSKLCSVIGSTMKPSISGQCSLHPILVGQSIILTAFHFMRWSLNKTVYTPFLYNMYDNDYLLISSAITVSIIIQEPQGVIHRKKWDELSSWLTLLWFVSIFYILKD